jgi:eukaryotic-like serine/threonine-protein kinase
MGVVYAALDTRRDQVVALKTLAFVDPAAIYRLKQEFRTLADVTHRNLIALYELFAEGGQWFFTMEYVEGTGFLDYVRPGHLDEGRLRDMLRQLAEGILAIHAAGKLHRDLKPSNVMVTKDGRAVILDFGIAMDANGAEREAEEGVWGTPAYMAPEQAEGTAVPASDWYALGGMLYEAMTGKVPFSGTYLTVLSKKMTQTPPRADTLVSGLPEDLVDLCAALLAPEVDARANGQDVLRCLGGAPALRGSDATAAGRPPLIGRETHLAELQAAYAAARTGSAVTALLHGVSGTGKSTLLDEFLGRVREQGGVVFAGRCYVRETVPFKGLDGVLDSLSRWLMALPLERQAELATPALAAAARLFPALGRIGWIPADDALEHRDPEEIRREAVTALRALLRKIAPSGRLVLAIDDFQWGDRDGARLLEALLAPPDSPGLLLVVAFRSDEVEGNPFLETFVSRSREGHARDISIAPLSPEESRVLAETLLGEGAAEVETIAREANGSPFLIEQLARYALKTGDRAAGRTLRLSADDLLGSRVEELPADARQLLETLAVAARPLDVLVARDAAGLKDERPLTGMLLAGHLLRPSGSADHLELYHDRIREAVVARIPHGRLAETHRRLAEAMESHGGTDPVTLYEHYVGVGDRARARRYASLAADNAAQSLAFDRAADLYTRALELARAAVEETHPLEVKLGDALANAGRGLDAAGAFLGAAPQAGAVEALELRRRAADQYLRCGHVELGFQVVDDVLQAVGVRPTGSRLVALLRLLARRAAVRLRGLRFRERSAASLPPATIRQLDVCWTVALGLVRVDNLRAADFQTQHLLLALKAGEPYRIARALACEAAFVAVVGGPSRARAEGLVVATHELAERTGHPHALGIAHLAEGIVRHFMGEFVPSLEACDRAERILRERCRGVWWEVDSAQEYSLASLLLTGAWDELARRVPAALREAESHGDRYSAAQAGAGRGNVVWVVRDEPDEARRMFDLYMGPWAGEAFHIPHWWSMVAMCQVDLYEAQGAAAWSRFGARWPQLRRSILLRVQAVRIETIHLRARCALSASEAAPASEKRPLLEVAWRDAARLDRERMPWAGALASLVRAGVDHRRGHADRAAAGLRHGMQAAAATQLSGYASAARRALGTLIGGGEGETLVREADAWFTAVGGRRPERLADMLVPGFTG